MMIDTLLNIIANAKLLELNIITRKTYNQHITINLTFVNERIQSMIYKCKVRTNLY